MFNYYKAVLQNYFGFHGRARRMEFWSFALLNFIISAIFYGLAFLTEGGYTGIFQIINTIYSLGVFIPSLAVAVRRLHDTGRSGWWLLIGLIPIIGWIVLLVFYFQNSHPGDNQYGPNPKASTQPASQV